MEYKYHANVVDNTNEKARSFTIRISSNSKRANDETEGRTIETDSNICYQVALTEYEHCIKRMDRLDNKIYILFTVCAILFVPFTNSLVLLGNIKAPTNWIEWLLIICYLILVSLCAIKMRYLLFRLIAALDAVPILRFDSPVLLERNMINADKKKVVAFIIMKYEKARKKNNELIDEKYEKVNSCNGLMLWVATALIMLVTVSSIIPKVKEQEQLFTEYVAQHIIYTIQDFHDKLKKDSITNVQVNNKNL